MRDSEFDFIRGLVYRRSRINLTADKRALVSARLGQRLRANHLETLSEYCQLLQSPEAPEELSHLIDVISTNHTFFFRESVHFDFLKRHVFPEMHARAAREKWKTFRIWSAAASSGEEPYSIAMTLSEGLPAWDWQIEASDISRVVLDRARAGIYPKSAVQRLAPALVRRFFQRGFGPQEGRFRVKAALREKVSFHQLNLLDSGPPSPVPYQAIFCRNVMIYFDRATREELIAHLSRWLVPGGYLFVGHSESLTGFRHALKVIRPAIYQRPLDPSHA